MSTKSLWQNKRKIPHSAIVKAPGLLPMLYTLREMSDELGVPVPMLRTWIDWGAPHQRDGRGNIWINGRELAMWLDKIRRPRRSRKLGKDEAYCLRCRKAVRLLNPQRQTKAHQIILSGTCPRCGGTINRGKPYGES